MSSKKIRGINILNPVDVDRDYYLKAIDFAIENNYNHIQINGPSHDFKRSNVDGMVMYKKYSQFNYEKDEKYVNYCMDVVNECLEKSHSAGIKTYMWHHELEVPTDFMKTFPEILNDCGDVEITHPLIKDFAENKMKDFFEAYPLMDGLVITYYETKIPLLRLKNQKLNTEERMEYVTRILYDACKKMGKELVVRTDAPLEEDYKVLLSCYEKVSTEMIIMDKWTQYDWSLSLPQNSFIRNIDKHPLLIETDIFGEYFGKGRLPMMLKNHIKENFEFCEQFNPAGYCSRIDRGGYHCFGSVNEINLHIMKAHLYDQNVDAVINEFFDKKYGASSKKVLSIMEKTEDVLRKTLFANGYYYSELSRFPSLNHCKNHFYFEHMREVCNIESDEWFVPKNFNRGEIANIFNDILSAKKTAEEMLEVVLSLKDEICQKDYDELFTKFKNLELVCKCWVELANVFYNYVKYFENRDSFFKDNLFLALDKLKEYDTEGDTILKENFHCRFAEVAGKRTDNKDVVGEFINEVKKTFEYECKAVKEIESRSPVDYVVCGGGFEGHGLKKECNFSDTVILNGEFARIPGNRQGLDWSLINAHGWFSFKMKVKENAENTVRVVVGGKTDRVNFKLTVGEKEFVIDRENTGKNIVEVKYFATENEKCARVQVDKISGHTPCVYTIEILCN